MRRVIAAVLVAALIPASLTYAAPSSAVDWCAKRDGHPHCPEPTPTPDPTPTPVPESSPTPTPSNTPTPLPSPTPNPSPTVSPTPDGWSLVFEDTFDTDVAEGQFTADGRWAAYPYPWPDTWNRGKYDPSIISVHDGTLDMHLRSIDGVWRSASISPRVDGATLYSTTLRIEVRVWATASAGYHASFLTWPKPSDCFGTVRECWPRDGELDFPEGRLDGTVSAFMHRQGATTGSDQDAYPTTARFTEQHTYVTEWIGGTFAKFYLDGALIGHSTNRVPLGPHRIQLQVQTSPSGTLAPAHVYIDSVRVWSTP